MKFIPILFSTPMVQAILDGKKSQTRRTKGLEFINESYSSWKYLGFDELGHLMRNEHGATNAVKCPYGQVGDILWVRETWASTMDINGKKPLPDAPIYKADYPDYPVDWNWKPNIHMTKAACRIFLKVTNIRVERLHDISEADAEREGVKIVDYNCYENYMVEKDWQYHGMNQKGFHMIENPISSFASLWAKINGEQSWNDNPFVWVIEFERIEKPENFI